MKLIIMADLEGAAGVERFSQTYPDEPFKIPAMRLLTQEVNACIQGIFDAEPRADILVIDRHGGGAIWAPDRDPGARYLNWGEARREIYPKYGDYSGYFHVGQHAMAGLPNAPLSHTDASKYVVCKRFNEMYVGEFGIEAIRAGHHGVPMLFLAGDDKAVDEARALVPNIVTVTTKWGEGWQRARHLDPEMARREIRLKAAEALKQRSQVTPVHVDPPYSFEVRHIHPTPFNGPRDDDVSVTQLDDRTVLFRFDDLSKFTSLVY